MSALNGLSLRSLILLNVSRAMVARHIKRLSGRVICRKGSDKKGFWELSSLDCIKKDVSLQYGKAVGVD